MADYVVFDLGGVLIDWNPRYLYRKVLPPAEVEQLLTEVLTPEWNAQMDAGYPFADALAERVAAHPELEPVIRIYGSRWSEMLGGAIEGTVALLAQLRQRGTPLYALTNWSAETFHHATDRFPFLSWFEDILVSGREGMVKPDPAIYRGLLERNGLDAPRGLFIDDVPKNVEGAKRVGLDAIHFVGPGPLQADLRARDLL